MQCGAGRTYRYLQGTPLYSFGFGLTYGQISYAHAAVAPAVVKGGCGPAPTDVRDRSAFSIWPLAWQRPFLKPASV